MSVVIAANGSPAARVRAAGVALLAVMALGVLCAAIRHRVESSAPNASPAAATSFSLTPSGISSLIAGTATFYAEDFQGRIMAGGQAFDLNDPSIAAANQWPLGTRLRLRRAPGGPWDSTLTPAERDLYFSRSTIVTVQDHGDFAHALDLSRAAFTQLGRPEEGVIRLLIEPLGDGANAPKVMLGR